MKDKLELFVDDLSSCSNSLLFDSGTVIATYGNEHDYLSLEVYGEVRLWYRGELYQSSSDMPGDLLERLAGDDWEFDPLIESGETNWFDFVHYIDGKPQYEDFVCEEDISQMTFDQFEYMMSDVLRYYRNEI